MKTNYLKLALTAAAVASVAAAVPASAQTGFFTQDLGSTGTFNYFGNSTNYALDSTITGNFYTSPSTYFDATLNIQDINGHGTVQVTNDTTGTSFILGQPSYLAVGGVGNEVAILGVLTTTTGKGEDFTLSGIANGSGIKSASASFAPVPEASTMVSFGAMLLLGGLFFARRKSAVRAN